MNTIFLVLFDFLLVENQHLYIIAYLIIYEETEININCITLIDLMFFYPFLVSDFTPSWPDILPPPI